jgi:hypothetical protein
METCNEHSGIKVTLSEHERRLDEYRDNIRRVHERLDDVNAGLAGMEKRLTEKMDTMCDTINPRLDGLERNQRIVFKICAWAGSALIAVIAFFRMEIGKLVKWIFWG